MLRQLRPHWIAVSILVVRAALGVFYSAAIPIWEAPDEPGHYEYARYIAIRHALPQAGDPDAEQISERMQPPLYYLLGALSISWINTSDDLRPRLNPFYTWGTGTGGVNYAVHSDSEAFPYQGTVLAVHVLRLLSVALSLVGIVCTYLVGLTIAPTRRGIAIGAMATHAFWPQFLFNGSVITNDVLASAVGSAVTLVMIRMLRGRASVLQVPTLALVLGLGLLSKLNTIALLPIAAFVVFKEAMTRLRGSDLRHRLYWGCSALAGGLALVVSWQVLQQMPHVVVPLVIKDAPFSSGVVSRLAEVSAGLDLITLQRAVSHTFKTFLGPFGWANLPMEPVLSDMYAVLLVLALVGILLFFVRRRSEPSPISVAVLSAELLAVLGLCVLLVAASDKQVWVAPGRYLLPAMSAFSVLLFIGCEELSRFGKVSPLPILLTIALTSLAVVIPFRYIMPAYARPTLLSPGDVYDLQHQVSVKFADRIQLLAYELDRTEIRPRGVAQLTLYWRALASMDQDYTVCVRLLGPNGEAAGEADCTYPGRGNYATSLWEVGDIFADVYYLKLSRGFPQPSFVRINVAVFRYPEEEYLLVTDPQGARVGQSATFGRLKVASPEEFAPDITHHLSYNLGDTMALVGYELVGTPSPGSTLTVKLYWKSLAATGEDYTVFVHVVDQDGQLWAQHDSQPRNNTYPTGLWDEGEIVEDERGLSLPVDIPAGTYEIRVGMYLLDTMQRLPAVDDQGNRRRDDTIVLTEVAIEPQGSP